MALVNGTCHGLHVMHVWLNHGTRRALNVWRDFAFLLSLHCKATALEMLRLHGLFVVELRHVSHKHTWQKESCKGTAPTSKFNLIRGQMPECKDTHKNY